MQPKRYYVWGGILGLLAGSMLALVTRPARLLNARVTAVTPGVPPIASVALTYGFGAAPVSVIVDVLGRDGSGGSATIEGGQVFQEVPINGALDGEYRITTTAFYRILGKLRIDVRQFASADEPMKSASGISYRSLENDDLPGP
jgi:hypothetical protein